MNWLLLRGLARQSGHWGDFADHMEMALPDDRVYRLDLPGTGSRYQEISPANIPEIRAKVQEAAKSLPRPLILVGLSMGGMVALDWASDEPHGLAGVVAINSSSGWSPFWQRLEPTAWGRVLRLFASTDMMRRERTILAMTSGRAHSSALLDQWCEYQQQRPVSRQTALRQIRAASRYRPRNAEPEIPTLLLASQGDRLVSHRCSDTMASRWQCDLAMHDWAGHDLPLDDPEWVVQQLALFRARLVQ